MQKKVSTMQKKVGIIVSYCHMVQDLASTTLEEPARLMGSTHSNGSSYILGMVQQQQQHRELQSSVSCCQDCSTIN